MFSKITSGSIHGITCVMTQVEVDIAKTLPAFDMVGLLSGEVREAKERVRVALKNSGIMLPPVHITVNISPADIRKEGTAYDLPIAVGILVSLGNIPGEYVQDVCMIGELGLNGEVKPIKGVLPIVREAAKQGVRICILPQENVSEGAIIEGIRLVGVEDFSDVVAFFDAPELILKRGESEKAKGVDLAPLFEQAVEETEDFADVAGQEACKRAALIAAAGFHHMLITGPPGAGKSMIARRISGILPALTQEECLEVSSIYSVAGLLGTDRAFITKRPFLAPHHTTTVKSLTGGGAIPRPGLFTLSHRGVLFLDELPEFNRECIEVMRQPLEEKRIQIARTQGTYVYPADFMLVAASNPCPCGFYPDKSRCRCSEKEIRRYQNKISGPIRDRIDLNVTAEVLGINELNQQKSHLGSSQMRKEVAKAREMQKQRFEGSELRFNSEISSKEINRYCVLGEEEMGYMEKVFRMMNLSARSYHKILKVARTIADLEQEERIQVRHLGEAVSYRLQEGEHYV